MFLVFRILSSLAVVVIPIMFGWWLFFPLAFIFACFVNSPYEIIFVGVLLDMVYYLGDGFIHTYLFLIFSICLVMLVMFMSDKIYWRRFL
jgi:hypothetical protein